MIVFHWIESYACADREYAIITCINYSCLDPLVLIYGFDIRYGHCRGGGLIGLLHRSGLGLIGWRACTLDTCVGTC